MTETAKTTEPDRDEILYPEVLAAEEIPNGLNHQQWLFCNEYVVDVNAYAAAKRAGYSESVAKKGYTMLKNPKLKVQIDRLIEERAARTQVSQDWVVKELKTIVEARDSKTASARVRALELLGKHNNMFLDKVEHTGVVGHMVKIVKRKGKKDS